MKKHTHLFNYKLPLNPDFKTTVMTNGSMTRKGSNGDGKVTFTDEGMFDNFLKIVAYVSHFPH